MELKTSRTYVSDKRTNEVYIKPSLTVQDGGLSIADLIQRSANGQPLTKFPVYHENPEDFDQFDVTRQSGYDFSDAHNEVMELNERTKREREAKAAEEKAKLESEELERLQELESLRKFKAEHEEK